MAPVWLDFPNEFPLCSPYGPHLLLRGWALEHVHWNLNSSFLQIWDGKSGNLCIRRFETLIRKILFPTAEKGSDPRNVTVEDLFKTLNIPDHRAIYRFTFAQIAGHKHFCFTRDFHRYDKYDFYRVYRTVEMEKTRKIWSERMKHFHVALLDSIKNSHHSSICSAINWISFCNFNPVLSYPVYPKKDERMFTCVSQWNLKCCQFFWASNTNQLCIQMLGHKHYWWVQIACTYFVCQEEYRFFVAHLYCCLYWTQYLFTFWKSIIHSELMLFIRTVHGAYGKKFVLFSVSVHACITTVIPSIPVPV